MINSDPTKKIAEKVWICIENYFSNPELVPIED